MVKHIVLYKLNDRADADEMIGRFLSMKGKIPQLKALTAGKDIVKSERSYDVALVCDFDSESDLEIYADHPVHLPVKEYVHSVTKEAHSVDFIF